MCELCSDNLSERKMAQEGSRMFANSLRDLADEYERLGNGRVKPHTEQWKKNQTNAAYIIRNLVNDWI